MESPFAAAFDPFVGSIASGAPDDLNAGELLDGIDDFDAFTAAEQRRQALNPTNVPRGNNRPKPTPTNRRSAGAATRFAGRNAPFLSRPTLSAFLSCLVLGVIIGVVNLLLNALIPGRLAPGLSDAGTLFVL